MSRRPNALQRSRGSVLLGRVAQTQDEIAARCGVSRVAVSQWKSATTKPGNRARSKLFSAYRIHPDFWDEDPTADDTALPHPPPVNGPAVATIVSDVIPTGAISKAHMLEQMAHELMDGLRKDPRATPLERARVMASVAATLSLTAKLTGQFELGVRILKLPIWKRIERALDESLRGFPEAAKAVAAGLRKVDEEVSRGGS